MDATVATITFDDQHTMLCAEDMCLWTITLDAHHSKHRNPEIA
jgi:hypothetical protein